LDKLGKEKKDKEDGKSKSKKKFMSIVKEDDAGHFYVLVYYITLLLKQD